MSTVGLIYGRDLCPESILNLGYTDIVTMLFSLVPSLLSLYFCLLGLSSQLLSMIFELLGFFQLLFKSGYFLFGRGQLILGLTQKLPLLLGLPLSALQGRISTLSGLFLLSQLLS